MEFDRPQHYDPSACVIAQQYSSAIFVTLRRLHSREEKLVESSKTLLFILIILFREA
jgi:hypothetical protein